MKWYQRMVPLSFARREASTVSNPLKWFLDWVSGGVQSYTGKNVTPQTALTMTAVYSAVRVLAETVASLPLHVYQRADQGKRRARDHPLYDILHNQPNPEMTAFSFWEMQMASLLLWGNGFSEIERDNGGRVIALWPLLPDKMKVERKKGAIRYTYTLPNGSERIIPSEYVLHFHGLSSNGLVGFPPIQLAREAIGLGLAAEEFGARFFGNGGSVSGVLEHPAELGEEGRKNLRQSFEETYGGLSKAHRLMILEEGLKYQRIGIPPNEAQFLETRKFQISEIARFFRVPPHMLADLDRSTNNNIEHQSLEFVKFSITPWVVRLEQSMLLKLFSAAERRSYYAEFSLDGLLRGDIKSRYEALHIARMDGIINADEWREMENLNPQENDQGRIYWRPVNMVPADTPVTLAPPKGGEPNNGPDGQGKS